MPVSPETAGAETLVPSPVAWWARVGSCSPRLMNHTPARHIIRCVAGRPVRAHRLPRNHAAALTPAYEAEACRDLVFAMPSVQG